MKYLYIRSTGELEAALLTVDLLADKYWIYDLSSNHALKRNFQLASIFKANYLRVNNDLRHKFLFLWQLISGKTILSINYLSNNSLKTKFINFFAFAFIRDALIPPLNSSWHGQCKALYCEKKYQYLFEGVNNFINISENSIELFLEKIKQCPLTQNYQVVVIGKNMNRKTYSLEIKKELYRILSTKFDEVVLVPHPRETPIELDMASKMGLFISNDYPFSVVSNSKVVFVLASSAAQVLTLMKVPYYWIFYPEEFTSHGGEMGRFHDESIQSFFTNNEIENYLNANNIFN